MWTGILSLEGKLDKLKICTINPKTTTKITKQRITANKSTKQIKYNHKKIVNPKEDRKKGRNKRGFFPKHGKSNSQNILHWWEWSSRQAETDKPGKSKETTTEAITKNRWKEINRIHQWK